MATVQQVRDLRAEGAPADLSPDSDMESPSMKQARELGYTASAFPDEAASPLPDIEPVFGRPRTPQPYDYTPLPTCSKHYGARYRTGGKAPRTSRATRRATSRMQVMRRSIGWIRRRATLHYC